MYLILAHKERELRGEEPNKVVHTTREFINRVLSGIWRRTSRITVHVVKVIGTYSVVAARFVWRECGYIAKDIASVSVSFWHLTRKGIKAVADRFAHPHAHMQHHAAQRHTKSPL